MPLRKQIVRILLYLTICLLPCNSLAGSLVQEINFTSNNNIEIKVTKKTKFKAFTLKNPDRLVIDIAQAKIDFDKKNLKLPKFVSSFRSKDSGSPLRMVFDLKKKIAIDKITFSNSSGKNKINIKISGAKIAKTISNKAQKKETKKAKQQSIQLNGDFIFDKVAQFDKSNKNHDKSENTKKQKNISITKSSKKTHDAASYLKRSKSDKRKIIVIDSGHGGKDPGTIGIYARTKEKNITLSYSRELAKQLNRTKKYRVYLTRAKDKFIPLRGRVAIARRKKADLFISIHANATKNRKTKGFSIYTLSEKSSDKQAERLARKENRADIISGMNFSRTSPDIVKTLIDLSQREAKNSSAIFAKSVIKSVRRSGIHILQNTHRFAGFAVLTAPDMASVLIELGYLTNKKEERLLNSSRYKRKVASSLVKAIDEYFRKHT